MRPRLTLQTQLSSPFLSLYRPHAIIRIRRQCHSRRLDIICQAKDKVIRTVRFEAVRIMNQTDDKLHPNPTLTLVRKVIPLRWLTLCPVLHLRDVIPKFQRFCFRCSRTQSDQLDRRKLHSHQRSRLDHTDEVLRVAPRSSIENDFLQIGT